VEPQTPNLNKDESTTLIKIQIWPKNIFFGKHCNINIINRGPENWAKHKNMLKICCWPFGVYDAHPTRAWKMCYHTLRTFQRPQPIFPLKQSFCILFA
jgi:hypothetical protein